MTALSLFRDAVPHVKTIYTARVMIFRQLIMKVQLMIFNSNLSVMCRMPYFKETYLKVIGRTRTNGFEKDSSFTIFQDDNYIKKQI